MSVVNNKPAEVLDLGKVNQKNWSKSDYEKLKQKIGMNQSLRGSKIVKDVISNLHIMQDFKSSSANCHFQKDTESGELNYNTIYQKYYGESFSDYIDTHKISFKNLIKLRRNNESEELLEIRGRMVDWMIEVYSVYAPNGSNEYTYFKSVCFLDSLIDKGIINCDNIHIFGIA